MRRSLFSILVILAGLALAAAPAPAFEVAIEPEPNEEAEEATGEPAPTSEAADGLSLHAVLEVFKEAKDVEDFEARLNDPEAGIVNLDLNADDEVDFVSVFEEVDGAVHVLILRVPISEHESQDVGSIELEQVGEDVTVQVVGDPGLYGPDYIVEPDVSETAWFEWRPAGEPIVIASADGGWLPEWSGDPAGESFETAVVIVVRTWPAVRVIYAPGYVVYRSAYRYRRYPPYWYARRPVHYSAYRSRTAHYRRHHRYAHTRNSPRASNVYKNNKVSSPAVKRATPTASGGSRATRSQTGTSTAPARRPTTTQSTPSRQRTNSGANPGRAGPSAGSNRPKGGGGAHRRR